MRWTELVTVEQSAGDDDRDLLAAAGYTHRLAEGLYTLLPLGQRVLKRITAIVRREMDRIGAHELTLPLLQPAAPWDRPLGDRGTRAEAFGPQLFRIATGYGDPLVLSPTHEEVAALVGAACSPDRSAESRILYQIQPRFRNQRCAVEHGLLHTREFVMADAYSFHPDREKLEASYASVREAFSTIVSNCGVSAHVVLADAGPMGGDDSEELVAPLPTATSTAAVRCPGCGYAASHEIAEFRRPPLSTAEPLPITEVMASDSAMTNRLTWIPFVAAGRVVLGVVPSGRLLSMAKLANALSRAKIAAADLHPASAEELRSLGASYDWISLVRTPPFVLVIADVAVESGSNYSIPSQRAFHALHDVNTPRDFRVDLFADICTPNAGAPCARCAAPLETIAGVEVGHLFKLGSQYTDAFAAGGDSRTIEMGCYGLGITRLMATIVEQHRDSRGIVWPASVAPFLVGIVPVESHASRAAADIYDALRDFGAAVLLDDSTLAMREKSARIDRLGIPFKITVTEDTRIDEGIEVEERATAAIRRMRDSDLRTLAHAWSLIESYRSP